MRNSANHLFHFTHLFQFVLQKTVLFRVHCDKSECKRGMPFLQSNYCRVRSVGFRMQGKHSTVTAIL